MVVRAKMFYLYQSGFFIETKSATLVFDYYLNNCEGKRSIASGVVSGSDFVGVKNAFVFVSHNHHDHYNPIIFKWREQNPNIHYIVSSDVRTFNEQATVVEPLTQIEIDGVRIMTFGSTDAGVSFYVEVDGLSIFHAGDLNLWHWEEESSKQEVQTATRAFLTHLVKMKALDFDIAIFPLDPRQGKRYDAGAEYFIREFKPKLFVPMHFGDRMDVTKTFAEKIKTKYPETQVAKISARGQQILF